MRINNPDGSVIFSMDLTDKVNDLTKKIVFDQYAQRVAYYQRIVKPSLSENMAKGILELCAAQIYNPDATNDEMDEFAVKTADKWGVDADELVSEYFDFFEYSHEEL
ncbi:MAG: hypothetical protein IJU27_04605 [Bacteroidales bacterium]|nr:hypothetical protein [Bacteroidales bacterium]